MAAGVPLVIIAEPGTTRTIARSGTTETLTVPSGQSLALGKAGETGTLGIDNAAGGAAGAPLFQASGGGVLNRTGNTGFINALFTVRFDSNGGSVIASQFKNSGAAVSLPASPARGTDIFQGWYKEAELASKWNFAVDTVAGDTTIYARWTPVSGPFLLGDTGPAGGTIFYVNMAGFSMADGGTSHYLEAAPADTGSYSWTNSSVSPYDQVTGGGDGIGAGRKGTASILTIIGVGSGATQPNMCPAAYNCKNASYGGFTDWFLPSRYELAELYSRKDMVPGLGTGYYWSSSGQFGNALSQRFSDGFVRQNTSITIGCQVRAVRAFY